MVSGRNQIESSCCTSISFVMALVMSFSLVFFLDVTSLSGTRGKVSIDTTEWLLWNEWMEKTDWSSSPLI